MSKMRSFEICSNTVKEAAAAKWKRLFLSYPDKKRKKAVVSERVAPATKVNRSFTTLLIYKDFFHTYISRNGRRSKQRIKLASKISLQPFWCVSQGGLKLNSHMGTHVHILFFP